MDPLSYQLFIYQSGVWFIICGAVSQIGGIIIYRVVRLSKQDGKKAEGGAKQAVYSSWPDKQAPKSRMISSLSCMCCCKMIHSEKWDPVLKYLSDALRCMVNERDCKYRTTPDPPPDSSEMLETNSWSFRSRLFFFALGQLFVAASTGFFEGVIYSTRVVGSQMD